MVRCADFERSLLVRTCVDHPQQPEDSCLLWTNLSEWLAGPEIRKNWSDLRLKKYGNLETFNGLNVSRL